MREKMVTDRSARVEAHRYKRFILGPIKVMARRRFRRIVGGNLRKIFLSRDYDDAELQAGPRLTEIEVD